LAATLFDLFGMTTDKGKELPTAALSRLGDGAEPDSDYWLHADPVFLKPDGDRLLLFDAAHLEMRMQDAKGLVALFNEHFAEDGCYLEASTPARWYLRVPEAIDMVTSPLFDVVGRNIDAFLPKGPAAGRWHALLNEVQMLFHAAQDNRRREEERLLPVNSLWLSGGGALPHITNSPFSRVIADDSLTRGFAKSGRVACQSLPESAEAIGDESGELLVVYHHLQRSVVDSDPVGWQQGVEQLQSWLEPLLGTLGQKRLDALRLYACNGDSYCLDRVAWRRFWKRRKPLMSYLDKAVKD